MDAATIVDVIDRALAGDTDDALGDEYAAGRAHVGTLGDAHRPAAPAGQLYGELTDLVGREVAQIVGSLHVKGRWAVRPENTVPDRPVDPADVIAVVQRCRDAGLLARHLPRLYDGQI